VTPHPTRSARLLRTNVNHDHACRNIIYHKYRYGIAPRNCKTRTIEAIISVLLLLTILIPLSPKAKNLRFAKFMQLHYPPNTMSRSSFTLERAPSERLSTRSSLSEMSVSSHSSAESDASTPPRGPEMGRSKSCLLRMDGPEGQGNRRGTLTFTTSTSSLKRAGSSRKLVPARRPSEVEDFPPKSPMRRKD
jgi:hypothetical protein